MAEHRLSLAIIVRERLLETGLVPFSPPDEHWPGALPAVNGVARLGPVAIVGLGYVGLPTALALCGGASQITGFDISEDRLRAPMSMSPSARSASTPAMPTTSSARRRGWLAAPPPSAPCRPRE